MMQLGANCERHVRADVRSRPKIKIGLPPAKRSPSIAAIGARCRAGRRFASCQKLDTAYLRCLQALRTLGGAKLHPLALIERTETG